MNRKSNKSTMGNSRNVSLNSDREITNKLEINFVIVKTRQTVISIIFCKQKNLVHQTIVESDGINHFYIGLTKWESLKIILKQSFSYFIWSLKDSNKSFKIKWKILSHVKFYCLNDRMYHLCMEEIYLVLFSRYKLLNTQNQRALAFL